MNRIHHRRLPLAVLALAGTFTAAACGRDEEPGAEPSSPVSSVAADEEAADTASFYMAPEETSEDLPPTIYYDLTRFEWYARGEPLVHDGRAYMPGGALFSASAGAMEQLGQFGGVDYYRQAGAGLETLYVPVYERYWLGFRPRNGASGG